MAVTTKKPAVKKPAIKKPPTKKPAAKKSVVKKPAPKKSPTKKPAVNKPALKKPVSKKTPASKKLAKKPVSTSYNGPKGCIALPEIEIIRRDSDRDLGGRRIKKVEVLNSKILVSPLTPADFKKYLIGAEILGVSRHGTALLFEFDKSVGVMVLEFGEGGQLRLHPSMEAKDPATAIVMTFTQGGQLRITSHFEDTKVRFLKKENQNEVLKELRGVGLDIVESPLPWALFLKLIRSEPQNRTIKEVLLDSNFIIGVGDIYSDEILYKCGLRYNMALGEIPDKKFVLLLQAAVETLYEATKHRGTTLPDGYFCDLSGQAGSFQNYLQVYGRDGGVTPVSLHDVEKKRFQNRWTYYSPRVQG